jgi:hypothetical protein
MERVVGIGPTSSAWKAEVITIIQYPQCGPERRIRTFEGTSPADLQSALVDRLSISGYNIIISYNL